MSVLARRAGRSWTPTPEEHVLVMIAIVCCGERAGVPIWAGTENVVQIYGIAVLNLPNQTKFPVSGVVVAHFSTNGVGRIIGEGIVTDGSSIVKE